MTHRNLKFGKQGKSFYIHLNSIEAYKMALEIIYQNKPTKQLKSIFKEIENHICKLYPELKLKNIIKEKKYDK